LSQQLAGFQIDEMHPGASGADYHFVFSVGRVLVVIVKGVLNAQIGIRTDEDEWSHRISLQLVSIALCFSLTCSDEPSRRARFS
jgi:hypothetical protein